MNPVFELNDLHVSLQSHHKETELVRGVSFAVAPGECLGILGESGSGKSMSMKAAMGLLDHSFHVKGSAQFQGEELLGKSAEELRRLRGGKVGIILQNPMTCFDPLYRIGQQIAETFSAHNNWTAEEIHIRSLELLEKMRIRNPEEVLEKYPHQLSGGMLQRIMIGIATAMKARIAEERLAKPKMKEEFVRFWLLRFRKLDMTRPEQRQALVDTFINAIYLYDDKVLITFNYEDAKKQTLVKMSRIYDEILIGFQTASAVLHPGYTNLGTFSRKGALQSGVV